MKAIAPILIIPLSTLCSTQKKESYSLHPDSLKKPGVPEESVKGPFKFYSDIFPGTKRDY